MCVQEEALRIFGHTDEQGADDIVYINWLHMARAGVLGLQYWSPTGGWGQAHMQARYVILRCLLEAGQGFVSLVKNEDGKTCVSMDRTLIRSVGVPAIGNLLLKLLT